MRDAKSQAHLTSLLDMLRLKGNAFLSIGEIFGLVKSLSWGTGPITVKVELPGSPKQSPRITEITPESVVDLHKPIQERAKEATEFTRMMLENCKQLGLRQSFKQAQRVYDQIRQGPLATGEFIKMMQELAQRVFDELEDNVMLQIDVTKLHLFENPAAFGEGVFRAFPSANEDIFEASMCLALDRGTACVMHLGRIVEVGLRAIAHALSLPKRNDWGKHLDDIEKELDKRYKASGSRGVVPWAETNS